MSQSTQVFVSVSIDTEEDNWGSYSATGATVENVTHLPELQALFDQWGVRATYLVNRPPLTNAASVETLGLLASRGDVEIGTHCHPWNTPPVGKGGVEDSMMCDAPPGLNLERLAHMTELISSELGARPSSFRAGRWGFGPTVAGPLAALGYRIDSSVSPFVDWTEYGGPDFSFAPHRPYRFDPERPLVPDARGTLIEVPATIGFLRGKQDAAHRLRHSIERSAWARLKAVGVLDRLGLLTQRWLSPETTSARVLVRLARSWVRGGGRHLGLTFHSSSLLPGATPFVRTDAERERLLGALNRFFEYCTSERFTFATLSEVGGALVSEE